MAAEYERDKRKTKQNRLKERVPVFINREKVFLKIKNIFQIRIAYNPQGGLWAIFAFVKLNDGKLGVQFSKIIKWR